METMETRVGRVRYQAIYHGEQKNHEGWKHDRWTIELNGVPIEYKTGLGNRKAPKIHPWHTTTPPAKPVPPNPDNVLHSLIMDWQCSQDTYETFCGDLGYDTDSRRALATYLACQEAGPKLRAMRLGKSLQELAGIYQDF